ncbi:hypothetical protein JK361_13490 [Streptomyces sp. 5-8]|uniref:Integral membrane protein n=1 Tax=Streptomyces musisoli TaxID=2802280 RepID=A0ABS1P097_9ACTN|nr:MULTISPECIES: hypothetical protein [Streptomyces]MBL1105585.1 hypothetical protein [Streptomyces musisoli]MBY8843504.1 hypothetical protein [Streptomyces sp. SP2-10]
MSTGPGRSRRVRPAVVGTVAALALAPAYAVFLPAAWLRTEVRGAEPTAATFHAGTCLLGGCTVTYPHAGEQVTAGLPVGTRAGGHAEGDTVYVRAAPGEPERVALAADTGRGTVAALLAVPGGLTLLALAAGAVRVLRDRRPEGPAQTL